MLAAARMVVTEGIGKGIPAHGLFMIAGNSEEILADERDDPNMRDIKQCKYGAFKIYADRRSHGLYIGDCLGERKRNFLNLIHEDGAIVVDSQTGQVCCGGFLVADITSGIGTGSIRSKAASAMATQAGGCYVVIASEAICGSVIHAVPASATLIVYSEEWVAQYVPVHVRQFEQWLCPLKFDGKLSLYNNEFVEGTRKWVLDDVDTWLSNAKGPRCKVLLAGPGFGKTAIAARLHFEMSRVLAIHFYNHSDSSRRDPRRMIASIACQIAGKLPQFKQALLKVHHTESSLTDAYALRPTACELADCLLFDPLRETPQPVDNGGRHLIIIDALDETEHDARRDLLDLVVFHFRKAPPWVAFLVTARPEADVSIALAPLWPTVLDADAYKDNCDADVRIYLSRILAPIIDEGRLNEEIEKLITKSEGLFLYLRYIRTALESGDYESAIQDALPIGLARTYQLELESALGPAGLGDKNSVTRCVVETIVAAQVPPHVIDELPILSGVARDEAVQVVCKLSRQLRVHDNRVYIFHKSFADWITGDNPPENQFKFIVDRRAAHSRLASACAVPLMRLLREEAERFASDAHAVAALERVVATRGNEVNNLRHSRVLDEYALRWSITHLVEAGKEKAGRLLLFSLRFLIKRATQIDTLIGDALLLRDTELLHRALLLVRNHLPSHCAYYLAEELWQRLLRPAETRGDVDLNRLANDSRKMARSHLTFSARGAYLTPADSYLRCVLEGHESSVNAVTSFDANGHTWLASSSHDKTVRIWNPMRGGRAIHLLEGHSHVVKGVTAFDDAYGRPWMASFSHKRIHIWDPITGEFIRVLEGHKGRVNAVAACVDNNRRTWLASCSDDHSVRIWNAMEDSQDFRVLEGPSGHKRKVLGVVFVRANGMTSVASGSYDTTVRVWDAINDGAAMRVDEQHDGRTLRVLCGHSMGIYGVTAFVGADGRTQIASCSDDKTVRIWEPTLGIELHVLECHSDWVRDFTALLNPGYQWVMASCSEDKTVLIWGAMNRGKVHKVLEVHAERVKSVPDNKVRIWDAMNRSSVHVLEGHLADVISWTAFKDKKDTVWVATCSSDKTVRIWELMRGDQADRGRKGHSSKVNAVTAVADATGHTWVASCSDDKTVRIWEAMEGGQEIRVLEGHSHYVHGVTAFNIDGRACLVSCSGKTIHIWDANDFCQAPRARDFHLACINGVTTFVDANGSTWLASCSTDMTVCIWDAMNDDTSVRVLTGHKAAVNGVTAFVDANGTWVASCSKDKTVRIWDATEGREVHVLSDHSGGVNQVSAFVNAKGTWVASGSDDTTVRVWDTKKVSCAQQVLTGHSAPVNGVTWVNAQGSTTWVASCSNDGTVRIWDGINGGEAFFVIPLDSPPTAISTVSAPARSGYVRAPTTLLAVGHENGQLTFWENMRGAGIEKSCCSSKGGGENLSLSLVEFVRRTHKYFESRFRPLLGGFGCAR